MEAYSIASNQLSITFVVENVTFAYLCTSLCKHMATITKYIFKIIKKNTNLDRFRSQTKDTTKLLQNVIERADI